VNNESELLSNGTVLAGSWR